MRLRAPVARRWSPLPSGSERVSSGSDFVWLCGVAHGCACQDVPWGTSSVGVLRVHAFKPDLKMWDPWGPEEVARRFGHIDVPWYIAAGWAIDLFLGSVRRDHEDIEIAVPCNRRAEVLDALDGFEFFAAGLPSSGFVTELPVAKASDSDSHQTWVREPASGLWRLDIFSEPSDGQTWICRRDSRIRMPYERLIERTRKGSLRPPGGGSVLQSQGCTPQRRRRLRSGTDATRQGRRRWLARALETRASWPHMAGAALDQHVEVDESGS